jgi:hypothetical protein
MTINLNQSGCKRAGLAIAASLSMLLAACGGGGTETAAPTAPTPAVSTQDAPPTLQSVSGSGSATVSVSSGKKEGNETSRMSLLDFEGKVTEGPSKDTALNGKLILKGTSTDEGKTYALEGKLITRGKMQEQQPITDDQRAQVDALIKAFNEGVAKLHDTFREAVGTLAEETEKQLKALREKWAAIDPKAADAQAQYEAVSKEAKAALDAFHKELQTLHTALQDDVKALRDKLNADIKALVPSNTEAGSNVIPVTGTLAEDGKIALTFDLGAGGKIEGTGTRDAQGKFTGTFTGPQAGDKGNWSAMSGMGGQPEPRPTPTGSPSPMPTPTKSPVPMPSPTGSPVPMPSPTPPAGACVGQQVIWLAADISEVTSPTVFVMAKGVKFGAYQNGFPIDHSAAKFVNGAATDIAVGKRVKVCAKGELSTQEATPLKAESVEFLK